MASQEYYIMVRFNAKQAKLTAQSLVVSTSFSGMLTQDESEAALAIAGVLMRAVATVESEMEKEAEFDEIVKNIEADEAYHSEPSDSEGEQK